MPTFEEAQRVKDWLKDPTTKLVARKLRSASKGALRRYDHATPDEVQRIQMLREVLNETLPSVIDALLVEDKAPSRFNWRKFLGL